VRIFSGGPVQLEVGFVVHSADYRRPETVALTDRLSVTSSVAILQDIGDKRGPAKILVAFGYTGWGPDQLEHEIEEHAWGIAEADPTLVFDEDRDNVWEDARKHSTSTSECSLVMNQDLLGKWKATKICAMCVLIDECR
jgi:putative transcriptional regulator